jgi:hypothetical protein
MLIISMTFRERKSIMGTKTPQQGFSQMDHDAPKTISVPEAGKKLGLGKNGSYAAAARGEIPVLRFGSRLRVPVVALERMLSEASSNLRMDTVEVGHAIGAVRKDTPA